LTTVLRIPKHLSGLLLFGIALWTPLHFAFAHDASGHAAAAPTMADGLGGPFELRDHHGTLVTDRDFRGKVMVIYFGYTNCPDICPIDVANIGIAMDLLGDAAESVQPLFITIDPERDTPARMAEWLGPIHASFLGLTGSSEEVAAVAHTFRLAYERVEAGSGDDYRFSHPGLMYVMGRDGRFRFFLPPTTPPEVIAAELRTLLEADPANGS